MIFFEAISPYLLSIAAAICLFLAVWHACRSNIKVASFLRTLFFLCVILTYFPKLDSLTAIGVNVKLRQNLDQAEEFLKKLKLIAIDNARNTYQNIVLVSSELEKLAIFDETNVKLSAFGVSETERKEIAQPTLQIISRNLSYIYRRVFERLLTWKGQELMSRAHAPGAEPEAREMLRDFSKKRDDWQQLAAYTSDEQLKRDGLSTYLYVFTPNEILDDKEKAIAGQFRNEIESLYGECRAKGGFTLNYAQFIEKNTNIMGIDIKVMELFGVDISNAQ